MQEQLRIGKNWLNRLLNVMIMTLLLVVVLSTATFAWYSISNIAVIDRIDFYASTSEQDGGNLCIDWSPTGKGYALEFANVTSGNALSPMIPISASEPGVTTLAEFKAFNRATQYEDENGNVFNKVTSDKNVTPYVLTDKSGEKTSFYLINKTNSPMNIKLSYGITGTAYTASDGTAVNLADKFRCALFVSDSTSPTDDDFVLSGILLADESLSDSVHYGDVTDGTKVSDTPTMTDVYMTNGGYFLRIAANGYVTLKAVAWYDGVAMVDDDGGRKIELAMTFDGINVSDNA